MEQHIKNAMNDQIIKEAAKKFDTEFESIKRVGGFENFIYEFNNGTEDVILRFAHSVHRSFEQIVAEIEFIDYLSKNNANVSTIIHNKDNEISFKIHTENDEYFTVSAFSKAPGTYTKREDVTEDFIYNFGQAVGRLHALTKSFKPEHKRNQWFEDDYIEIGKRNLPKQYRFVIEKAEEHTKKLQSYETSIEDYGLIHTDLHYGNMYYDGTSLTFFDFDDASYKHFISDIAIILFYQFGISMASKTEIEDRMNAFLKPFIKGYETQHKLDQKWYELLNEFFKLRILILIMVVFAAGEEVIDSGFGKIIINRYIPEIQNDIPFIDVKRVLNGIY